MLGSRYQSATAGFQKRQNPFGRGPPDLRAGVEHAVRPQRPRQNGGRASSWRFWILFLALILIFLGTYQWKGRSMAALPFRRSLKGRSALPKKAAGAVNLMQGQYTVDRSDLVLAVPTDNLHLELIEAGRQWHKGVRTYIAANDSGVVGSKQPEAAAFHETWEYIPDDEQLRALHPGDTRAALTPFLAHQALGETYKWMMYGDDDTMFFVEGVLNLVKDLDPNMPYFITDHLWWSSVKGTVGSHPNVEAPRCLPCNYTPPDTGLAQQPAFNAPQGCPCTAELLCATDERQLFEDDCHIPLHGERTYSMHGGAGALLSIGLMRKVPLTFMQDCLAQAGVTTGGDALLTICLWKAGYAHTDPGFSFFHPTVRMFDPGPEDSPGLLYALTEALSGRCDPSCQLLLRHVVTSHIRSRQQASLHNSASMMRALSNAWDLFAAQTFVSS